MRELIVTPDPKLHLISKPIESIDGYVRDLADEMVAFMRQPRSVLSLGLAAVQLGELARMIAVLINPVSPELREHLVIINPRITKQSDQMTTSFEGCLSISGGERLYRVRRHKLVKLTGTRLDGKSFTLKGRDVLSFVVQHEVDHLDGVLITDRSQ